eukprot:8847370-Pyramimonas_sp.AAC.2
MPPLAERQLHRLTHWPCHSRRKACFAGGGREEVRRGTDQERDAPRVWIDFSFPGTRGADGATTPPALLDFEPTAIESADAM